MIQFQGDSNTINALNASSAFENTVFFPGSALEQSAMTHGKSQLALFSFPEAFNLPLVISRQMKQRSPLMAETLSLRELNRSSQAEWQDVLTGNSIDSPLVQPGSNADALMPDRIPRKGSNNQRDAADREAAKATLSEAIASVKAQLKPFADDPLLTAKLREAFGNRWNIEKAQAILERLSSDDHSKFPDIRLKFFSSEQLQAQSAFAASTNTIYLFEDFLSENLDNPGTIATVLLEEVGHYIDARLNQSDSPGDEGAMFAAIVQNHQLSDNDWQALKKENDFAILIDKGVPTIVEQAVLGGTAGNDYIVGTTVNDEIYGGAGNDTLSGGASNDYLYGDVGDDVLDGGAGNDTMRGLSGNDVYYVDSAGDYVLEEGDGIDTVASYVDFSLTATNTQAVENLSLLGGVATQATGNALHNTLQGNHLNNVLTGNTGNDTLIGNAGDDTLDGGAGNDSMSGGVGNDTYYVDAAGDKVVERTDTNEGTDTINSSINFSLAATTETAWVENLSLLGSSATQATGNDRNNTLQGNSLNNVLRGGIGNDTLIGNAGNDTLDGGVGNDTYYVDSINDKVLENANSGTDTVISFTTNYNEYYSLDPNVENLIIGESQGYGGGDGAGNDLNNYILGNINGDRLFGRGGNDTIDGGDGFDDLRGNEGNDILNGGDKDDNLRGNEGNDILNGGDKNDDLWGSEGNDALNGEDGIDSLFGDTGNDYLYGGSGNDNLNGGYDFDILHGGDGNDGLNASRGIDQLWGDAGSDRFGLYQSNSTLATIQDFSAAEGDSISIYRDGLAIQLKASQFVAGTGVKTATTMGQRVLYDTTTGELFYDADGSGNQFNPIHIATLANKAALNAANIYVAHTPAIVLGLQQDTGTSSSDRLTSNATIKGNFTMPGQNVKLSASFDGVTFVPVTATTVDADGNFTLDRTQLTQINGGTLPDGSYTLHLKATDGSGNVSNVATLAFTLDTVAPALSNFKLAPQFDVSSISGIQTVHKAVTLTGQTTANATVKLQTGATTTANASGVFEFQNVALTLGANAFTAEVSDAAGNKTSVNLSVQRIEPFITGGLKLDTGNSSSDGKTFDSTITGQFTLAGQFAELTGSFDGSTFVKLSPTLNADGSFTLDRSQLAQLKGGSLTDGAYNLSLKAKDVDGNVSSVKQFAFTLDTTAAEISVKGLVDGIRWQKEETFSGTLKNFNLEPATEVFYQIDNQAPEKLVLNAENGTFGKTLNTLPTEAGLHTLKLFSIDEAGNQQTTQYTFLVRERKIIDDDQYIGANPIIVPNPQPTKIQNDPIISSIFGTASTWLGGGGLGGYGAWGDGYAGNPGAVANRPNYNYVDDLTDGQPSYLAKLAIILDSTITKGITPANKQGALVNRFNVLMTVGDIVDQEGFYDRMSDVMHGIFDEADDLIHTKGEAKTRGVGSDTVKGLYKQLTDDPDAVKLEVFQATLFSAVYQVFADNGFSPGSNDAEKELSSALLDLATTYASFDPQASANGSTSIDFLDSLWRAQKSLDPQAIRNELQRSILALDKLLEGVANPIQAFKFVNNLLKAAGDTASLDGEAIKDAQFLRELVAFGFEVAKLNPAVTASDTPEIAEWLETLWKGSGDFRQAEGGFAKLFDQLSSPQKQLEQITPQDQLRRLNYLTQLVKTIGLIDDPEVKSLARSSAHLSYVLDLGSSYAALNPSISNAVPNDASFLTLVAQGDLQGAANELERIISGALANIQYTEEVAVVREGEQIHVGGVLVSNGDASNVGFNLEDNDPSNDRYPIAYQVRRADGSIEFPVPGDTKFRFYLNRGDVTGLQLGEVALYPDDILFYPSNANDPFGSDRLLNLASGDYAPLDKVLDAIRLAPYVAGPQIAEQISSFVQSVKDHPILTGLAIGGIVGAQFLQPVGLILDVGFIILGGAQAGFSLASFFYKAATAENQSELWDASRELVNFFTTLATTIPFGGLTKLDPSDGLLNTTRLLDTARRLWREVDLLQSAGGLRSISDAIEIPFRVFANTDTAVGRLLQYGSESVAAFLRGGFDKFEGGLPTIDGLADFADRFRRVSEVAERLVQHEDIATVLSQYPEAIKSVLEFGSEAVESLARRSGAGDNITPWLQRIDQSPQGREILEIYSGVDNALGSTNPGTVLEGQVALIAQENGFDVINFQKKFGSNGSLGEVDVETPTAILEMTVSSSGKLSQIRGLLTDPIRNPLSKPVILYAPNYGNTAGQDIINAGAYVVRTEQELIQLLTQLGQP